MAKFPTLQALEMHAFTLSWGNLDHSRAAAWLQCAAEPSNAKLPLPADNEGRMADIMLSLPPPLLKLAFRPSLGVRKASHILCSDESGLFCLEETNPCITFILLQDVGSTA